MASAPIMYSVEVRCDIENLANLMSKMREWLDARRFEPDSFRDTVDGESVRFLVQFKTEGEAVTFAHAFSGQLSLASLGGFQRFNRCNGSSQATNWRPT